MKQLVVISFALSLSAQAALTDISPIGKVNLAEPTPATPAATVVKATPEIAQPQVQTATEAESPTIDAKAIYTQSCFACHGTGAANAPKLDDKTAWETRVALGLDGLTASALKGKGAMPPKGGAMNLTDEQIKAVVEYMFASVQ